MTIIDTTPKDAVMQNGATPLGWLYVDDDDRLGVGVEICNGMDILIGRDPKQCRITNDDPSTSNHHLRIFSTIYNADEEPVQGFVHAEDMSTNGSYLRYRRGDTWAESSFGKGNAVLSGDQNQIRHCDGTVFGFDAVASTMPNGQLEDMNRIQE
ncbi:hypothetical protein N7G274_008747 [Stereocaulon virgatum]|uniref:FHA domain-containing protein n=1 Tax=Stereocaulon virgatum TaxID=373712 RepID=A0ABR4A4Y2_9LECA